MPEVVERDEVAVVFIRVADEVPARAELEAIVGLRGRHFYGVFDESRPLIEHYRRHGEIDVLVPVR